MFKKPLRITYFIPHQYYYFTVYTLQCNRNKINSFAANHWLENFNEINRIKRTAKSYVIHSHTPPVLFITKNTNLSNAFRHFSASRDSSEIIQLDQNTRENLSP